MVIRASNGRIEEDGEEEGLTICFPSGVSSVAWGQQQCVVNSVVQLNISWTIGEGLDGCLKSFLPGRPKGCPRFYQLATHCRFMFTVIKGILELGLPFCLRELLSCSFFDFNVNECKTNCL